MQTRTPDLAPSPEFSARSWLPVAVALVAAVQLLAVWLGLTPAAEGRLVDADGYQRLMRVERLLDGADWYDGSTPLTNAPFGETWSWTRPLDLLLAAGGLAGSLVMERREALFAWGMVLSPLFHVAIVLTLVWAAAPLTRRAGRMLVALAAVLQPGLLLGVIAGRPDHHAPQLLLLAAVVGLLIRHFAMGPKTERHGARMMWIGLFCGLGLWVSVEAMLVVLLAQVVLGLSWALAIGADRRIDAADLVRFGGALLAATCVGYLAEWRPSAWGMIEYDRLSIIHLTLVALLCAGGLLLAGARSVLRHPAARLGAGAAFAVVAAITLRAVFPKFFQGPFAAMDPVLVDIWFAQVAEQQPLWPRDPSGWSKMLLHLGPALVGLGFGCAIGWRDRAAPRGGAWLTIVGGLLIYGIAALAVVRTVGFLQTITCIPFGIALATALRWDRALLRLGAVRVGARVPAFILAAFWPLFLAAILVRPPPPGAPTTSIDRCPWKPLAEHLGRALETPRPILMTYVYPGSEISWRTGFGTVATPLHRNTAGIVDSHRFLTATTEAAPLEIVQRRGITHVVVCSSSPDVAADLPATALHSRLVAGTPPAWLARLPLPAELDAVFRVYAVSAGPLPARGP